MNLTESLSSNMYLVGCIVCFIFSLLISFIDKDLRIYDKHNGDKIMIYPFMPLIICLYSLSSWLGIVIIILGIITKVDRY